MRKNKLVWPIICAVMAMGIVSIFAFIQKNEGLGQKNQESISKKDDDQNGERLVQGNIYSKAIEDTKLESKTILPTTKELEEELVLGKGTLPVEITMGNTEIFSQNGINDVFAMQLLDGELTEPTKGTILSDEVCEPDEYGYFHCWNDIKLSGGEIIRVLGIHDMYGGVPCLSPGTIVVVTPYKDGYILLQR